MNSFSTNMDAVGKALSLLTPVVLINGILVIFITWLYFIYANSVIWRTAMAVAMFSTFGATIGMFMGASASPIVTSILPPVITLISGYLALIASKDMPTEIKIVIPGALVALLLSLLFSAFYMKFWYVGR
jgi:hypothetical protein